MRILLALLVFYGFLPSANEDCLFHFWALAAPSLRQVVGIFEGAMMVSLADERLIASHCH
jgi:hypothetical protein